MQKRESSTGSHVGSEVAFRVGRSPGHGWIIVSIGACCATLALLAVLQFSWIGEFKESQQLTTQRRLGNSLRLFNRNLQLDISNLVTVFQSNTGKQGPNRLNQHLEQYYLWQRSYSHSPAIQHVFVYETPQRGTGNLTELLVQSGQVVPANRGAGLAGLRRELDEMGFRPGREIPVRWRDTWMFYPRFMAAARPIGTETVSQGSGGSSPTHSGFLILKLDWDYIAERLLPEVMREYFTGSGGEPLYDIALSVDGESHYIYRPTDSTSGQAKWDSQAASHAGFSLLRSSDGIGAAWIDESDASRPLLLATGIPPAGSVRYGARQRVPLALSSLTSQVIALQRPLSGVASDFDSGQTGAEPMASLNPLLALERARVFIAGEGPYSLVVSARHVDGSLQAVVSSQYERSLAMAFGVLLVLAAAMSLAVLSAKRAARLADLRMDFVAGVSHELRTPLSVIRMIGENMADGLLGSGKKARQYGDLLRNYGLRLSQMVEHTLQLAAIESGQKEYQLEALDVSEILDEVLADAKPLVDQAGFALERIDGKKLPAVRGDEVALRQCLGNLINNAVKYGQPGQWVGLDAEVAEKSDRSELQIQVQDRGHGIPPEELNSIFAPYYRGQTDGKARIPGSGLGLKLAREMVRGMGGELTVESEIGHGSTFTVHLPL